MPASMRAVVLLYLRAQFALSLSASPVNYPQEGDIMYVQSNPHRNEHMDVADESLPRNFKPTWQMHSLRNQRMESMYVSPIRVHGVSIVVLGMVKDLSFDEVHRVKNAVGLCDWFDEGSCHVRVVIAHIDPVLRANLEANMTNLRFIQQPPSWRVLAPCRMYRTQRYAELRNLILQKGLELGTDYLMPADMDDIVQWDGPTFGAITNALSPENRIKWDGVAFASNDYYDWWALRCNRTSPNCWRTQPVSCNEARLFTCLEEAIEPSGVSFTPVDAAFNGLALYRTTHIGDCRYDGVVHNCSRRPCYDCEHVAMTRCMVSHGTRMMLSSLSIHNTYTGPSC
jgi:hypothetical protein